MAMAVKGILAVSRESLFSSVGCQREGYIYKGGVTSDRHIPPEQMYPCLGNNSQYKLAGIAAIPTLMPSNCANTVHPLAMRIAK